MESELQQQALADLGRYLKKKNYSFTTVTPQTHEFYLQRNEGRLAANLRDIFGWCLSFERNLLEPDLWELMERAAVLEPCGDLWKSKIRWSSLGHMLFMHSAFPTDNGDAVFFGPDTYRFIQAVEHHLNGETADIRRAVDIGCGSGAGAVRLALDLPDAEVAAVDINPSALNATRVNSALAEVENVKVQTSNLLAAVQDEPDLIIANPPYMHDPGARAYRHGGGSYGTGLSLDIVDAAIQRLAAGGSLLLYTGVAIVDGDDIFLRELERRLQDTACSWSYREMDPDVFGEELLKPHYAEVERIAAVVLTLRKLDNQAKGRS